MNNELVLCSRCGQKKPTESFRKQTKGKAKMPICTDCKRINRAKNAKSENWNRQYRKHGTVCIQCNYPSKVDPELHCQTCQKAKGFHYCNKCGVKKMLLLEFYSRQSVCKECIKKADDDSAILKCDVCGIQQGGGNILMEKYHSKADQKVCLCVSCHMGLGNFKRDIELLKKAIRHLQGI